MAYNVIITCLASFPFQFCSCWPVLCNVGSMVKDTSSHSSQVYQQESSCHHVTKTRFFCISISLPSVCLCRLNSFSTFCFLYLNRIMILSWPKFSTEWVYLYTVQILVMTLHTEVFLFYSVHLTLKNGGMLSMRFPNFKSSYRLYTCPHSISKSKLNQS